jgi:nucleoside 2-deoxyribosyltransferase
MSDNFEYDIYLAGPFFNDIQKARMDAVKKDLINAGFKVADPRELGPVIVDTAETEKTPEFFKGIFDGNIEGMNDSYMMVASLDDRDIGTSFEMGYMFSEGKSIVSFAFDGGKTNVMLGQAVDRHFTDPNEMIAFLTKWRRVIYRRDNSLLRVAMSGNDAMKAEADE